MRLRRTDLSQPGIERHRRGRGFSYCYKGRAVGAAVRERIEALVIPPAWTDVWICPDERGHLQAVGVDAAGRKQYRYHDQWRVRRDREKFARMTAMADVLPKLRRTVEADLRSRGLTRRRVLAAAVRLLDRAAIRVGGEAYAVDDPDLGEATYGLATILRDHVSVSATVVTLSFPGKGGVETELAVDDPDLAKVIRALLRRPDGGDELLGYRNGRAWHDVSSSDVNDYLSEVGDQALTAKDFRTWHATVAATASLCRAGACQTQTARRKAVAQAMRDAAEILGNTAAVARKSYVDPRVVDLFEAGALSADGGAPSLDDPQSWRRAEKITIEALNRDALN